jgi:hypothetical protein
MEPLQTPTETATDQLASGQLPAACCLLAAYATNTSVDLYS